MKKSGESTDFNVHLENLGLAPIRSLSEMKDDFSAHSKNYNELVDQSTKWSGFGTDDFNKLKLNCLSRKLPELLEREFKFLDYGCGSGNLYKPFNQIFSSGSYFGTDISEGMIQAAQDKYPGEERFFELGSPKWKQVKYDLIFAANVFHHIPHEKHSAILMELKNLLNVHGKIIIWEHNPINPVTRKIVENCVFDKNAVLIPSRKLKQIFHKIFLSNVEICFTTFFPKWLEALIPFEPYLSWLPLGAQYIAIGENPAQEASAEFDTPPV